MFADILAVKSELAGVANLKYTTSVGTVAADRSTVVSQTAFKDLGTYVAKTTPLPDPGTYAGAGGGTAVVTDVRDAAGNTTRTVVYTNYVNEDGMILNGNETAVYGPSQNSVHYLADVKVTGTHTVTSRQTQRQRVHAVDDGLHHL